MATYKVIQDIEAEDKLVGPFSLRQFIYGIIVAVLGFIIFKLFLVNPLFALPFLPPMILFGFLAAPFGHDQSSEVWLLAKIRFFLKPRMRIWNQSGLQELVTITVPKKVEQVLTNGLNQYQVQSRLQALAQTIDTRGWAVKGVNVNMFTSPVYVANNDSDRLLGPQNLDTTVPEFDITPRDDMLDAANNPVAQQVDQLMRASDLAHRQQIMDSMNQATQEPQAQNMSQNQPLPQTYVTPQPTYGTPNPVIVQANTTQPVTLPEPAVAAPSMADEAALLEKVHKEAKNKKHAAYGHMRVLETPEEQARKKATKTQQTQPKPPVTQTPNTDILNLASNDDLTVATIARQAHKNDQPPENEVVVSLR